MINIDRSTCLNIAINDEISLESGEKIDLVFKELFGEAAHKILGQEEDKVEVIYRINKPIGNNDEILKDFYQDLEILLEELREYRPYFTQVEEVPNE